MSLIETLRERRSALKAEMEALLATATGEARDLNADEDVTFHAKADEIRSIDARVTELVEQEQREAAAAKALAEIGAKPAYDQATRVTAEPATYRKDDVRSPSYFGDLFEARMRGNTEARDRLVRNNMEQRAISTTTGAGGEFAPPAWLVADFVALARPGRVTADLVQHEDLPSGVSTINLPTVSGGTATATQASQNTAVNNQDLTTSSVSSGITTIAGQQVVSLQLLQQSGTSFDRVVLQDLAADYAKQLGTQVISGSGSSGQLKGILNAGYTGVTYTDASPAVAGAGKLYAQIQKAWQQVATTRFQAPSVIVMHPRRWAWIAASFDSSNRPLVVPTSSGAGRNAIAGDGPNAAQGYVGDIAGLPVYVDPNIPTNLGAGTNEDRILVLRAEDLWLYESPMQAASFDATYANQLSILFRVHGYAAFIPHRYTTAGTVISGTGLVTPTF